LKVKKMPLPIGLLFAGLVVGAILGAVVLVTVLYLAWKLGKVADAYSQKLTTKQ
jgi:gas vesicle protein